MLGQENPGPLAARPPVGAKIAGEYEILQQLGTSEFGTSFKAGSLSGNPVVLKFLSAGFSARLDFGAKQAEVKRAACLSHPNLIAAKALEQDGQYGVYLVRDFISGRSAADIIREKSALNQIEFLDLFKQLCKGLASAHKKKIVHGDLKPTNILITDDYAVCIVDFALGQTTDPRDDIYSLGWIMYESLGGAPRRASGTLDTPVPFLSLIPARKVDEQTETLVFRCLEKDPEKRYQSPEALLADLKRIEEGDELKPLESNSAGRGKGMVIALSLLGVLLIAGIACACIFSATSNKRAAELSQQESREADAAMANDEARADKLYAEERFEEAAEIYNNLDPVVTKKFGYESREHLKILHKLGQTELWNPVSGQARSTFSLLGQLVNRRPDLAPRQYHPESDILAAGRKMFARGDYKNAVDTFQLGAKINRLYNHKDKTILRTLLIWEGKARAKTGELAESADLLRTAILKASTEPMGPDLSMALTEYGRTLILRSQKEAGQDRKSTLEEASKALNQSMENCRARGAHSEMTEIKKLQDELEAAR